MKRFVFSLIVVLGCYDLQMDAYTPCVNQGQCIEGEVCALGYCVPPHPDLIACGNGRLEEGEVCDDGDALATGECNEDCSRRCVALHLDGVVSVGVNESGIGGLQGAFAGAPRTWQFWVQPLIPDTGAFQWTLLSKEPAGAGNRMRITVERATTEGLADAVLWFAGQEASRLTLAQGAAWYHLAYVVTATEAATAVQPYLNGLPQDPSTLSFVFDETQTGDLYLGAHPPLDGPSSGRFKGYITGFSIGTAALYSGTFRPATSFEWQQPWPQQDGYYHAFWNTPTKLGAEHEPSRGRVYWGAAAGAWYPLWLDAGFRVVADAPWCVQGQRCGDGVKAAFEACDDGNEEDGDGCSQTCHLEN